MEMAQPAHRVSSRSFCRNQMVPRAKGMPKSFVLLRPICSCGSCHARVFGPHRCCMTSPLRDGHGEHVGGVRQHASLDIIRGSVRRGGSRHTVETALLAKHVARSGRHWWPALSYDLSAPRASCGSTLHVQGAIMQTGTSASRGSAQ